MTDWAANRVQWKAQRAAEEAVFRASRAALESWKFAPTDAACVMRMNELDAALIHLGKWRT